MAKHLLYILLLVLIATTATAQAPQWQLIREDLQGMDDMVFTSHDTGYVLGGTVMMATYDSGEHFVTLKIPNNVSGSHSHMSWPTNNDGYVAFANTGRSQLVRTHDAGKTFDTVAINITISQISFPSIDIGYLTGQFGPNGTDTNCVAKTTDGGATWKIMHKSTANTYDLIKFVDDVHGAFLDQDAAIGSYEMDITYNGMDSIKQSTGSVVQSGGLSSFMNLNDDGSWIMGVGGLQRSTDSGATWTQPRAGSINTACFCPGTVPGIGHCLAFEDHGTTYYTSYDYGKTWVVGATSNANQHDTLGPNAASYPSTRIAYLLGTDSVNSNVVLLKLDLPVDVDGVQPPSAQLAPGFFTASLDGQAITFTAAPAVEMRTIEISDLLGRNCMSVNLPSNGETTRIQRSALRAGTYFARLGDAMAKFTIW